MNIPSTYRIHDADGPVIKYSVTCSGPCCECVQRLGLLNVCPSCGTGIRWKGYDRVTACRCGTLLGICVSMSKEVLTSFTISKAFKLFETNEDTI